MPTSPTQMAEKLRKIADSCGKEAAKKRSSGLYNQNPTRRRMDMLKSIEADAARLERMQGWAAGLAELWSEGQCPTALYGLQSKTALEILATYSEWPAWKADYLIGLGITQPMYLGVLQALEHYSAPVKQEKPIDREIRDRKRVLVGVKIAGFFPTPEPVIQRMLELAEIPGGQFYTGPQLRILEPSAGWGNIADAIRECYPQHKLEVCEIVPALQEILKLKGYTLLTDDIFNLIPMKINEFDYILSNPPFEVGLDIAHVQHYYRLLRPAGRLVSVMCEGAFFRADRVAKEFQRWLLDHNGYDEKLPSGSFERSERPTSVAARLIVIDKSSHALY